MRLSLNRIILYVRNVSTLATFYRDTLELSVIEEFKEEWVVLQAGHCELALHKAGEDYVSSDAISSRLNNNAKLVFAVHGDIEVLRAKLIANGTPMGEIKSYPGFTGPLCDGTDPEGNVFQLSQA